jgi:hypothetical protein
MVLEVVPIPDTFIRLLCCAFRYDYCDFPKCWGGKRSCTCLCFEIETIFCKPPPQGMDNSTFFILDSNSVEIVTIGETMCKCYEQCFCLEYYCELPELGNSMISKADGLVAMKGFKDGTKSNNDVVIYR